MASRIETKFSSQPISGLSAICPTASTCPQVRVFGVPVPLENNLNQAVYKRGLCRFTQKTNSDNSLAMFHSWIYPL